MNRNHRKQRKGVIAGIALVLTITLLSGCSKEARVVSIGQEGERGHRQTVIINAANTNSFRNSLDVAKNGPHADEAHLVEEAVMMVMASLLNIQIEYASNNQYARTTLRRQMLNAMHGRYLEEVIVVGAEMMIENLNNVISANSLLIADAEAKKARSRQADEILDSIPFSRLEILKTNNGSLMLVAAGTWNGLDPLKKIVLDIAATGVDQSGQRIEVRSTEELLFREAIHPGAGYDLRQAVNPFGSWSRALELENIEIKETLVREVVVQARNRGEEDIPYINRRSRQNSPLGIRAPYIDEVMTRNSFGREDQEALDEARAIVREAQRTTEFLALRIEQSIFDPSQTEGLRGSGRARPLQKPN